VYFRLGPKALGEPFAFEVVFVHNQFPDFSFQFADVLIATSKRILRVALENLYFEFWHFAFAPQTRTMSDAIGACGSPKSDC
jgi:hypothetical protein